MRACGKLVRMAVDPIAIVIEDDPDARALVAACLRRLGLRVREAASAAEGLAVLAAATPDLICLDVRLPDLSGLALCERIRASPRLGDVPVMFITALAKPADRLRAEVAGADGYLTKPFRAEALTGAVRELIALSAVAPS
jgi:CheY-like chemotaxis protein